jgi:pyruvate dehydrogenase E1 component alpha subunit
MNRSTHDPIDFVKKALIDSGNATAEDMKAVEKRIRSEVKAALEEAKTGVAPDAEELFNYIYAKDGSVPESVEKPNFIRMPDYYQSIRA